MQAYTINCGNTTLSTDFLGAQLNSFCIGEKQYLWQRGEPWSNSAPVLFPIIGELKGENKTTLINGKPYRITIHGFVGDMLFKLHEADGQSVTLCCESTNETLKCYPFEFKLFVKYTVFDGGFTQSFTVKNMSNGDMPFFVGAHPGFNTSFGGNRLTDYTIMFEKPETAESYRIGEDGIVDESVTEPVFVNGCKIPLNDKIFEKGALVFEGLNSRSVTLTDKSGHGIKMDFDGFDYFGIWRMTGEKASYVCLEPWTGMNDCVGEDGIYTHKRGIKILEKDGEFTVGYKVTAL